MEYCSRSSGRRLFENQSALGKQATRSGGESSTTPSSSLRSRLWPLTLWHSSGRWTEKMSSAGSRECWQPRTEHPSRTSSRVNSSKRDGAVRLGPVGTYPGEFFVQAFLSPKAYSDRAKGNSLRSDDSDQGGRTAIFPVGVQRFFRPSRSVRRLYSTRLTRPRLARRSHRPALRARPRYPASVGATECVDPLAKHGRGTALPCFPLIDDGLPRGAHARREPRLTQPQALGARPGCGRRSRPAPVDHVRGASRSAGGIVRP